MEASRAVGASDRKVSGAGFRVGALAFAVAMALGLSACGGGGGGGNVKPSQPSSGGSGSTGGNGGDGSTGSGGSTAPAAGAIDVPANTVTVRSDTLTGAIDVSKSGAGTLVFTGNNTYSGTTQVQAGSLYVDGDQSGATGATNVASGSTLGGKGTIGGNVSLADGATLAPGSNGALGALTINGNLSLSSGSVLDVGVTSLALGDFVDVKGNLTLDGTLKGSPATGSLFGPGVYRLFNYGGSLVDNGLTTPDGLVIQTGVAHQVNLVDGEGMDVRFWDGDANPGNDHVIGGGSGTWQGSSAAAHSNWTYADGSVNGPFSDGAFAVFQAAPGTVTVDASLGDVKPGGMQFASDGYLVRGDALHLAGTAADPAHSIIRVGDGSIAGAGYVATIDSELTGGVGVIKTDAGTLVLSGDNTYLGGTTINGGTLQLGNGGTRGSILGDVTDNGSLAFNRSDISTFAGKVTGTGSLQQNGPGTLILTAEHSYLGGTTINDGILQVGDGGTTGSIRGDVVNNHYLRFDRSDDITFAGNITGTGALLKDGAGKLILTGNLTEDGSNTANAPTTVTSGTLQVGNGGTTGSIAGDIKNNASLIFDRADTVTYGGRLSGTGTMTQAGTGTLVMTGLVSNNVIIASGTLQLSNPSGYGTIGGSVINNGTLIFDVGFSSGTAGGPSSVISGNGNLIKRNTDTIILTGNNTYTGGTLISGGTLQLGLRGTTGWIEGDIVNNGTLLINRSDDITLAKQITGTGLLRKQAGNTLTVTTDLQETGGAQIDEGTLQLGNGGTSGWLVGDVVDYAGLTFNRSDDVTFGGVISGNGRVTKLGGNTLTLTGANTFTGGMYIADGTLRIASGGSLAYQAHVGGNNANAVLRIDQGGTIVSAQLEDGATLDNSGTLLRPGDSPIITGGSVTVLNHDGGVIDNVTAYDGQSTAAVALYGNSTLTNGPGSTIRGFSGVSSSGVVNNVGGAITGAYRDGVTGSPTEVNNTNGGVITAGSYPPPSNFALGAGVYTLASSAVVNNLSGSSILGTLRGAGLFDGGTVTNDGASLISGQIGVSIGTQSLASSTVINTGGSAITGTQAGIILSTGGTITNGAGSTIASTATPSGDCATTLACAIWVPVYPGFGNFGANGSLTLTNAGYISGDVQMDPSVVNDITLVAGGYIHGALKIGTNTQSTLALDGGTGTTQLYSNAVTGSTSFAGNLVKNGAGTWILDNNALQGVASTTINAGSLGATQALAGPVTVNLGGTLDGVPGVLGNLGNAGKVAVHGGDTTVGGNYAQAAGGTLAVSLGSKLAVSGSATLGGTLEVTGAEPSYVSNTHTEVLTATGGVSGQFSQLVKDSGVVFTETTVHYDANSAWLDTTGLNITQAIANRGGTFTPASFASARRVQAAFTQLDSQVAVGGANTVTGASTGTSASTVASNGTSEQASTAFLAAAGQFQQAPSLEAAQSSLQSLSGELHAASAAMTFEAIDASSRAMSDHFDDLLGKELGVGMWTQNLSVGGGMARTGYDGIGFQLNGWMVGSDRQVGSSGVAGFAFGQSQGLQQLDQSADRNRSRNTEGMLYAGTLNGDWYTQGRVGFGHFQQDVNRRLLLGTSAQGVGTQYGGNYNVAYGETGLHLDWAGSRIIPFVNVEYANIRRDGFAEQGAGGFGLQANAQTLDRWQAGAGMRANRHWDFGNGRALDLKVSAQFQRTLASRGDVFDASFVGLRQYQPLVGIGLSRYSGLLNIGLDARLSARTALTFGYDYQRGQRDQAQGVSARWVTAF